MKENLMRGGWSNPDERWWLVGRGIGKQLHNDRKENDSLLAYIYRGISHVLSQIIFKFSSNSPNLDVNHL